MAQHSPYAGIAVLGCIALGAAVLLQGCASIESAGSVTTGDGHPFTLRGSGKSLLIEPGAMTVEIGDRPPSLPLFHSSITIKTRRGEIVVETRAADYAADTLTVRGSTHGLSADLAADWNDIAEGTYREGATRDCTYSGWCPRQIQVRRCPRASYDEGTKGYRENKETPECTTVTEYRDGYHGDCEGTRRVLATYERYRRHYRVDFLSPIPGAPKLGQFQGRSAILSRQVDEQGLEPCH
jgi:hypothetical protein